MTAQLSELKFKECEGCINRELDPFRCTGCRNGNRFESADSGIDEQLSTYEEELSYSDFKDYFRSELE